MFEVRPLLACLWFKVLVVFLGWLCFFPAPFGILGLFSLDLYAMLHVWIYPMRW